MIERMIDRDDLDRALSRDAAEGLASSSKAIPSKWFYDENGCRLFEQITELPEYYLTRREEEILAKRSADIARIARATTLVELGAGSARKTRLLLNAMPHLRRYIPFDVSEESVVSTQAHIARDYGIEVHGIVGDFEQHLDALPNGDKRIISFLGSTIGNLTPRARRSFFTDISNQMDAGESLLLGTDLVKNSLRIEIAYNDAAGITAEFNRNILAVLNRRLGANFNLALFDHLAFFDDENERMEMRLMARDAQRVRIAEHIVEFEERESIHTEFSAKFTREKVESELAAAGFSLEKWWTDNAGDYAVSLASKVRTSELMQ